MSEFDKQEILDEVMDVVEKVKRGEESALEIYPQLNELKKSIDGLRKELYDHVIAEHEKYDKREEVVKGGYKITIASRTNYKYKQDEEYKMISQQRKNRKELIKNASDTDAPTFNPSTGELIEGVEKTYSTYPKCKWVGSKEVE